MLKNIRIAHFLVYRFPLYMLTAVLLSLLLLPAAFGQDDAITDAVNEGTSGIWARVKLYAGVIAIIFLFSAFFYVLRLFQKDKLLKTLLDKYVVFQMKDGRRYRGTMRLEILWYGNYLRGIPTTWARAELYLHERGTRKTNCCIHPLS